MQPVPYPVTTPYGVPGSWAAGVHTGQDHACPIGTPVIAAAPGEVLLAEYQGDYGNRIDIQRHGGRRHSYSHLSSFNVVPGHQVSAGQVIGASGNSGRSSGPHVHYEERDDPGGYNDHVRPIYPDEQAPQSEEEAPTMAGYLATFFTNSGTVYEANLAAGTYWAIPNPETLNDRKAMLTRAGIPWFDWDPNGDVANTHAFGLQIH